MFALELHTGQVRWEFIKLHGASIASLAIASEHIYLTDNKVLYALSTKTGDSQWNVPVEGVHSHIVPHTDRVYVVVEQVKDTKFWALEASSGALIWTLDINDRAPSPRISCEGLYGMDAHGKYCLIQAGIGVVSLKNPPCPINFSSICTENELISIVQRTPAKK